MGDVIQTDVIVLGVGTCGEDASLQLLDAGLEVVGIEADWSLVVRQVPLLGLPAHQTPAAQREAGGRGRPR